ncbi:MAG: efflux RND transporter periplasmic adaptor subunit [Pirellulales bacterium]
MGARLLGVVDRLKTHLSGVLTMGVLLAIGFWGHHTHWRMIGGPDHAQAESTADEVAATEASPEAAVGAKTEAAPRLPNRIEFKSREALEKAGVGTTVVAKRPMVEEIQATGEVDYDATRRAQLSSRVAGTVWRIEKQVGEPIRKGDVLVIVESADVGQMKADFLQAVVNRELKAMVYERLQSAGSALPEVQRRTARAEFREANIRLFNAQQTLVNHGLPIRLEDVQGLSDEEMAKKMQFLGLPDSIVAGLDPVKTTANLIPLVAPFDGVVIGRDVALGELVSPEGLHFEIADVRKMWIRLGVRKEDANSLAIGQPVSFVPANSDEPIESRIAWISTEVDEMTRTLQVRAEVDNDPLTADAGIENYVLRANTFGLGRICIRESKEAVVVPSDAVQWSLDGAVVFVQTGPHAFESRRVETGVAADGFTEVLSGLSGGEVIAARGSHVLKSEALRAMVASAQ